MEIVGIIAGIMVLISFIPKNVKTIRIINITGCILFVIYGVLIKSISVSLTNAILLLVHLYRLFKK